MATGGWGGAMGGGAWGSKPAPEEPDVEVAEAPAAHASAAPLYGGPSGSSAPQQPQQQSSGFGGAFKSAFSKQKGESPKAFQQQGAFDGQPGGGAYGTLGGGGGGGGAFPAGNGNLSMKEAELDAREKALNAKEKELKKLETELAKSGQLKKKNWPICWPWLYHNIAEEIPEKERRVVREVYFAWWGLCLCLSWNLFCASVMLGYNVDQKVASWFLAVIYTIAGVPLAFIFWYRKLYNGAKSNSTFGYIGFFIMFVVHIGFCIWASIAVPFSAEKWSFAGFVASFAAFDASAFAGVIYIIGGSLWACESLYSLWCLKDVYFFFRGHGGVQQVKQEVAVEAFKRSMNNK